MTTAEAEKIRKNYGAGVVALRRLAGIKSQGKLGELVGMAQATISEIERGSRSLRSDEIEMFIAFFAERIPGFTDDDCLSVLRSGGSFRLRLVTADNDAPTGLVKKLSHLPARPLVVRKGVAA